MSRKIAFQSLSRANDLIRFEIVKGHFILLDNEDFRSVSERHWYVSIEKRCDSIHFVTSMKIQHRRHQKVTLQSFLTGIIPGVITKLIDKDSPFDYRRSNLMIVSSREQSQAFGKRNGLYSSIYKGVSYRKERDKWAAMIKRPDGKHKLIGYFDHEEEAALAYNKAASELFGEHAFQNEVKDRDDMHLERKVVPKNRFHKPRSKKASK